MSIDERIQALTESVELLAHMQHDEMAVFREEMKLLGARVDQIAQLVLIHEHRIKDIETGQQ
ncbi:MAG: hypothetical protein M3Y27_18240 [Acidobacteriota bacterium]|nr:hypothetical protein [Acidobacteriota bacterium]